MSAIAFIIFDIDGVIRDVGGSYRRALADTVEHFTQGAYRPTPEDIDALKAEGLWNNDWEASQELVYRYYERSGWQRSQTEATPCQFSYEELVAFFQSRYRGTDPEHWNGYICQEPLLLSANYFEQLTHAGFAWGFFSGATRASANYVLQKRLGLKSPVLIAMEDAPGKPDPTGLLLTVEQLGKTAEPNAPIFYLGDTVADLYTVEKARQLRPDLRWVGIGILPPHVQATAERSQEYTALLEKAGAEAVFRNVEELTPAKIQSLIQSNG
jgi:HAD superfamily phosphatase